MTFGIYTLGCRVNQYESRVISEQLCESGHTEQNFNCVCDIYIINSCAVTAESVRKSKQMIRRALKHNSNAHIIVTGCFAQILPENTASLGSNISVIGNKNKISTVLDSINKNEVIDVPSFENAEYENYCLKTPTRAREYIKIQDGCEGKCAYCIIPKARGPIRSKPRNSVIEEVKALSKKGTKEIILTGIEIASYEYDLCSLLEEINTIDGIERISLGSLEPTLITEKFTDRLCKLTKLTPHFHISVQSGCTTVLNRMRRKYNITMLENSINILRAKIKNLRLTCDIIVGFPGETEKEFEETKEFLKRNRFLHTHIFPYSIRPDTPAAEMQDQIPEAIKAKRLSILNEQQAVIKQELLSEELTRGEVPVLFETYKNSVNIGHSDNYIEYTLETKEDLTGKLIFVKPSEIKSESIKSVIAF